MKLQSSDPRPGINETITRLRVLPPAGEWQRFAIPVQDALGQVVFLLHRQETHAPLRRAVPHEEVALRRNLRRTQR